MIKIIPIVIFFGIFITFAKASDIEIIELHKTKSLDQLVLDSSKVEQSNQIEENANKNEINSEDSLEDNNGLEPEEENNEEIIIVDEESSNIEDETVTILKNETISDIDEYIINAHIENIVKIKSKSLASEFINILSSADFGSENITDDKIYYIIKKLYEIGEIGKAYTLTKKINMNNVSNNEHLQYFNLIQLNYLFSTFKLGDVCDFKNTLLNQSFTLPEYLLEKTDIFCLTLENKFPEAKLLNSLLLDSEKEIDQNFQKLFNYMIADDENQAPMESLKKIKSSELIFLFSAMLRINELALEEDFIEIDPLNLSIPVILSESTNMNIRIKAANKAFYNEVLSIDSLSALYQSVDFNSNELSKPEETLLSLENKNELIMAFYYQLANIQIFPDQRLKVILDYWSFAKSSDLERIAYAITKNIVETINPTVENAEHGIEIAFAHISNQNYTDASKWINLYLNSNPTNDKIEFAKFLISLNENDELDTIINYLSNNYESIKDINDQRTLETFDVLINFLEINTVQKIDPIYNDIEDNRLMPSYFLLKDLSEKIEKNNNLSLFILSLISINNKSWVELHPEHLNLVLESFSMYNKGDLIKPIILEILNELEIF